jgi:hypothetical protein
MMLKVLAFFAVLVAVPQAQLAAAGQTINHPGASFPAPSTAPASTAAPQTPSSPADRNDCEGGTCDYQPPHITIATPAPAPAAWPLQDRIAWGANIALVILAYAGIMLALSTLKKIERQTRFGESAAMAAAESSQAALLHTQAILHAERPWILITVEPSPSAPNGFSVVATNRGRSPARIVFTVEETRIAIDEGHLPAVPEYTEPDPDISRASIILLPGEFTAIKSFSRSDVKDLCGSEERLRHVESWEERIFLYGKVVYNNLMAPAGLPAHETAWFCRYIHGRQKSGLVMAGPLEYNVHT